MPSFFSSEAKFKEWMEKNPGYLEFPFSMVSYIHLTVSGKQSAVWKWVNGSKISFQTLSTAAMIKSDFEGK